MKLRYDHPVPENMAVIPQFPGQARTGVPTTTQELAALIAKRDELNGQLESMTQQRSELAHDIERTGSDPAVRAAPLARLKALDDRIAATEKEVVNANAQIAAAKENGVSTGEFIGFPAPPATPDVPPPPFTFTEQTWGERFLNGMETTAPVAVGSVLLLGAVMYWWISRTVRGQLTRMIAMQSARLEELQRSVDTVAVEMERVSENQRYVSKMVGDKTHAP